MSLNCQHEIVGAAIGSIAQWLEHWSCKPGVASSILAGASIIFYLLHFTPRNGVAKQKHLHIILNTSGITKG